MSGTLLELSDIEKHYRNGDTVVRALDGVSLKIRRGEFVAIMGQSGSGKSTLMNILGCLDRPTAGSYKVLGREAAHLEADALAALQRETFGFVFQKYNLLATASAGQNVEIPSVYAGLPKHKRVERAARLLERLGLGDRTEHRPSELSGGQQQRVAIARALVNDPPVGSSARMTGGFGGPAAPATQLASSLVAPIFTGGRLTGNLENATARQKELAVNYQKTVLTAFREVEDALAALRSAHGRAVLSRATVAESQNAYDIARARFDAGAIDYLNLLETQRSLYQAQDSQIAIQQGRISAFVQVRKALGS